jgi:NAD+-dependent protein deacetylase sirtuin 2
MSNNADKYADCQPILSSIDIDGIAKYILDSAENIIVMVGAGISVSAGIPDFRTPGTGLYSQLEAYNLPNPEAIFTLDFFRKNPAPFYTLAKEIYPGLHRPTPTHYFLKLLADKGKLLRVFTQNIDSLEGIAGLDKSLIVAAHGNFDSATCIDTGKKVDPDEVKEAILAGEPGWSKMNKKHGGLVKPDIVFFGENLPKRYFKHVVEDFPKCDMLIVMGTSLTVYPFAALIDKVDTATPRLLINREVVRGYRKLSGNGFCFDEDDDDTTDVALLKDCDDGVRELAAALGWLDDLEDLIAFGTEKYFRQKNFLEKTF